MLYCWVRRLAHEIERSQLKQLRSKPLWRPEDNGSL